MAEKGNSNGEQQGMRPHSSVTARVEGILGYHEEDAPTASSQLANAALEDITHRSHPTTLTHHLFSLMPLPPPPLWPASGRTMLPTVTPPSHLSMPLVRLRQQIEVNRSCSFFIMCSNWLVGGAPRLERRKRAWKWHLHERWDMCV